MFATGRYPTLEHLAFEAVLTSADAEFERGLTIVLDGIEPGSRRPRP